MSSTKYRCCEAQNNKMATKLPHGVSVTTAAARKRKAEEALGLATSSDAKTGKVTDPGAGFKSRGGAEKKMGVVKGGSTMLTAYAYSDKGKKHYQQDRRTLLADLRRVTAELPADLRWAFFAVYDGHGGNTTSSFLQETLHLNLCRKLLTKGPPNKDTSTDEFRTWVKDALITVYRDTEAELSNEHPNNDDGSTAVTALVIQESVWLANVGDSKAVLARQRKTSNLLRAVRLTTDHTPILLPERRRIEAKGGFVDQEGRVCGILGVSRSFGDLKLKPQGVTVIPDISRFSICAEDRFMVIGCDGLWNVFTPDDAVAFVQGQLQSCKHERVKYGAERHKNGVEQTQADTKVVTTRLVEEAVVARNATDNVTALVVVFGLSPAGRDLEEELAKGVVF